MLVFFCVGRLVLWGLFVRGTAVVRGAACVWSDSLCTEMMLSLVNTGKIAHVSCKIR